MKNKLPLVLALICAAVGQWRAVWALDNGLARTPPMGWLAWERFTCETDCQQYPDECINAALFEAQANHLRRDGYRALGYEYVNIDDCWSELEREPHSGRLVANRSRFPQGLEQLATKLHSAGLKLGLYGDCGMRTCANYPAQLDERDSLSTGANNHFEVDAHTLRDWQIDSFKFDGCHIDPLKAQHVCPKFSDALQQVGRPILLICEWPFYMMYAHAEPDWPTAASACNVWRYYDDIEDSWTSILNTVDYTVEHQSEIVKYHGPGHWFDPDQLVIGNFGLSLGQARAQMAIWCVWSAPLYMSNDLRSISGEMARVLKNAKLIQVDQDKLGVFGQMVAQSDDGERQVFVKPLEPIRNACPSFALVLLNRATLGNKRKVSFKLRDLLVAAPIRQAALNQRAVWDYEMIAQGGAEQIKVSECLRRLRNCMSHKTNNTYLGLFEESHEDTERLEYAVEDLFGDEPTPRTLTIDDQLELLVEPQSVRALKLVELSTT